MCLGIQEDIFVTRAPGRLDVMGGIADYSGSLVLQVRVCLSTTYTITSLKDMYIRMFCSSLRRFFVLWLLLSLLLTCILSVK